MSPDKQAVITGLLDEYLDADKKVEEAKQALEAANKVRSDVCKKLYEQGGRGPYEYQKTHLGKIVIRGSTYFFRGKNEEGTIKVG